MMREFTFLCELSL